jgi:hypothetical protein
MRKSGCELPGDSLAKPEAERRPPAAPHGAWLTLIGGVFVFCGTFLPWLEIDTTTGMASPNGLQLSPGTGLWMVALLACGIGLLGCAISLSRLLGVGPIRPLMALSAVAGLVVGVLVGAWVTRLVASVETARIGYGAWILLLGCALTVIGGVYAAMRCEAPDRARPNPLGHMRGF